MSQRHKHADLIHAWAEGAEIECRNLSVEWRFQQYPNFYAHYKYRIKPQWWENIPEHGILARNKHTNTLCLIINVYHPEDWEPLTNEEIERFKR